MKYVAKYLLLCRECMQLHYAVDVMQNVIKDAKEMFVFERWTLQQCCLTILFIDNLHHQVRSSSESSASLYPSSLNSTLVKSLKTIVSSLSNCLPSSLLISLIRLLARLEAIQIIENPNSVSCSSSESQNCGSLDASGGGNCRKKSRIEATHSLSMNSSIQEAASTTM